MAKTNRWYDRKQIENHIEKTQRPKSSKFTIVQVSYKRQQQRFSSRKGNCIGVRRNYRICHSDRWLIRQREKRVRQEISSFNSSIKSHPLDQNQMILRGWVSRKLTKRLKKGRMSLSLKLRHQGGPKTQIVQSLSVVWKLRLLAKFSNKTTPNCSNNMLRRDQIIKRDKARIVNYTRANTSITRRRTWQE